ncbi:MAG: glycosyl transferase family 2 [Flavobacteriaceae bacterium]|nr:glycosyl transferase family 2 [Flavobacteriaceae bacterium]
MISVNNLSLYFGGQDIFKNISFMINKGDKIGLVGKNGAGKSTLLNLLSENIKPNDGSVSMPNGLILGYLTQDLDFKDGKTIVEEAQTAFTELNQIRERLDTINKEINERSDYESKSYLDLISESHDLDERYRILGGNDIQSEISQVLSGLGFTTKDFDRQTTEFSGGWRMRIELAKILLQKPDVLLLDEPTNHLDIESIIWLEQWLKKFVGAIVLVSHDRLFLDSISNRTIEISFTKINDYKAKYSKYLELRKDRIEKQIQAKKNQDKFISETKILINKFRAKKNKAAFAQTLIAKLDKLEIIHVEKEDVESMKFSFPPAPHSGKVSLSIKEASKSYDDLDVLEDINLEIVKGEKIAFVGKNGEGKSTLAKMISGHVDFVGDIILGHSVKMGYYAQNQADFLDENSTILETIENAISETITVNPRTILGSFLFSNDDVSKKIKVLSGGERARVSLCKLLLEPYNLLVMDEPTNHLDITSKELLKKALMDYDGSLIVVSHDREFLQGLTQKVYEFRGKTIKEYHGDVNTFLSEKDLTNFKQLEMSQKDQLDSSKLNASIKGAYYDQKDKKRKSNKLKSQIKKIEREIDKLSDKLKKIDLELSDPIKFNELSSEKDFFEIYGQQKNKLSQLEEKWTSLVEELENT